MVFDSASATFTFRPGPIFANVVVADEVNRAPAKTQSALLEAMEEHQVTVEGRAHAPAAPVPGGRDAESGRVRGHLPAARGAARPLSVQDLVGTARPRRSGRSSCATTAASAPATCPGRGSSPCSTRRACSTCAGRWRRCAWTTIWRRTWSRSAGRPAARPRSQYGASVRGAIGMMRASKAMAAFAGREYVTPGRRQGRRRGGAAPPRRAQARGRAGRGDGGRRGRAHPEQRPRARGRAADSRQGPPDRCPR